MGACCLHNLRWQINSRLFGDEAELNIAYPPLLFSIDSVHSTSMQIFGPTSQISGGIYTPPSLSISVCSPERISSHVRIQSKLGFAWFAIFVSRFLLSLVYARMLEKDIDLQPRIHSSKKIEGAVISPRCQTGYVKIILILMWTRIRLEWVICDRDVSCRNILRAVSTPDYHGWRSDVCATVWRAIEKRSFTP